MLASTGVSDREVSSVGDEDETDSSGEVLDCKVDNCVGTADDSGTGASDANDGAAEIRTFTIGDCDKGDLIVGVPEDIGDFVVGATVIGAFEKNAIDGINEGVGCFGNGTGD